MARQVFALLAAAALVAQAQALYSPTAPLFTLSKGVYDSAQVAWVDHTVGNASNNYAGSWLGMNLNFAIVTEVFAKLNQTAGVPPLANRGEAHITVITPPEYTVLSAITNITILDINAIAQASMLQYSEFEVVCVARYRKNLNSTTVVNCEGNAACNHAYNIVVRSPDLVKVRRRISDLYQSRGGEPALFDPDYFLPHITLGFTVGGRDMFDSDGVYKGEQACWAPIKVY